MNVFTQEERFMNIAAYCRVSTDKEDQLNSLDAQKRFFAEFTEKNNHNLVRLYADEGISGTKIKNRKEFQRLMRDARQGLFDMVVVKDISRFARNTVDFLQSIREMCIRDRLPPPYSIDFVYQIAAHIVPQASLVLDENRFQQCVLDPKLQYGQETAY